MNGKMIEDMIILKIGQMCDIKREPAYDHIYKLDFIINQFNRIHKLIPVGVQVTTNLDNVYKMKEFYAQRLKKTMVDRSLYIEVHPEVDIDAWGAELIYNAIVSFVFETEMRVHDIFGVRINPSGTYEFFDLNEKMDQKPECEPAKVISLPEKKEPKPIAIPSGLLKNTVNVSPTEEEAHAISRRSKIVSQNFGAPVYPTMAESVHSQVAQSGLKRMSEKPKVSFATEEDEPFYSQNELTKEEILQLSEDGHTGFIKVFKSDKGFGFIYTQKESLFFHITNVQDTLYAELTKRAKESFSSRGDLNRPYIKVKFNNAGYDSSDAKYRKAINVQLA